MSIRLLLRVIPPRFFEDLAAAEREDSLPRIANLVAAYLRANPLENLATLEQLFRERGARTHLIAEEPNTRHPCYPPTNFRKEGCEYALLISMESPTVVSGRLERNHQRDPLKNLRRLAFCGIYQGQSISDLERIPAVLGGRLSLFKGP